MITHQVCKLHEPCPLEDEVQYVLRKALRGTSISPEEFPDVAGISSDAWAACLAGKGDAATLELASIALKLHAPALLSLATYQPIVPQIQGVYRCDMSFDGERVNAWIIRDENTCLVFDAGYEPSHIADLVTNLGAAPVDLFITHEHRDHIGGITALAPHLKKHWNLPVGQTQSFGSLTVSAFDLSGHYNPSTAYLIRGLSRNLCVVGDALFAGSIGGCKDPFHYDLALRLLKQNILSLPDDTILLPGHGPATTVAQEKKSNPFFAS